MAVYTGSPRFAASLLPQETAGRLAPLRAVEAGTEELLDELLAGDGERLTAPFTGIPWNHLFLREFAPESNYDQLIQLARRPAALPDRVASMVGSGLGFHGFKGRSWAAIPGNIHLAVHLTPNQPVDRSGVAFTVLAVVSVVETLDGISGLAGQAETKWVNDILLGEGKAAGVLAYTQTQGQVVSAAVLGLGVNVEATPEVEATPFVPGVTSVADALPSPPQDLGRQVFLNLLRALDRNYRILLEEGLDPLLERYRDRSMVVGREVTICTESSDRSLQAVAQGRVARIGDNLELLLEGRSAPVTGGRLALGRVSPTPGAWAPETVHGTPEEDWTTGTRDGSSDHDISLEGSSLKSARSPSWHDPHWRRG